MKILGKQGKTCCDILHSFTVPRGNEQGAAGLPVSCLGMQGGKTGKNQFPGAAGESRQDNAPWSLRKLPGVRPFPQNPEQINSPKAAEESGPLPAAGTS